MSPEARLAEAKVHPLERDQTSLTAVQNFAYQPARSRETYGNTQYALGKGVSPLPPRGGGTKAAPKSSTKGAVVAVLILPKWQSCLVNGRMIKFGGSRLRSPLLVSSVILNGLENSNVLHSSHRVEFVSSGPDFAH